MDISYPRPRKIVVANHANDEVPAIPLQGRYIMPPGQCAYCDAHRGEPMMPPHAASLRCQSGRHAHCTCDACF